LATDFAILDQFTADIGLEVDLNFLATVRAGYEKVGLWWIGVHVVSHDSHHARWRGQAARAAAVAGDRRVLRVM
jgi:uncharacterized RDD family membrane protein YckC